jgi:TolB-like protein
LNDKSLFQQLRERHVIRTALIYVALLWAVLQVADLLAEAGFIDEQLVRWLILLGVGGLPLTLLASWFLETPWKQRQWIAVIGDLVIIVAVGIAAALFAWQQWFTSFTRPTVAVLGIEATDLRPDSADLAAHLGLRLRTALATRSELRVIELSSSRHPDLDDLAIADKAAALDADYLLTGTVAQAESRVRLNVQLYGRDGELLHGESYADRLLDQAQLQNRVLADLWPLLPLPDDALPEVRRRVGDCRYPDDRDALLAVIAVDNSQDAKPEAFLEAHGESGMLQLAQARTLFSRLPKLPPTQRPVTQRIAMQHLANLEELCPLTPDAALLRVANTREPVSDRLLHEHPNSAELLRRAARHSGDPGRTQALLNEAKRLDPLGSW